MNQRKKQGRRRSGWLIVAAVLTLLFVVTAILLATASAQNGSIEPETRISNAPVDGILPADPRDPLEGAPLLINLRIHTVLLMLTPTTEGREVSVEAEYDPAYYLFTQETVDLPGRRELRIELAPTGSTLMALLRAKLGGPMPTLRIGLPADVPLEIVGEQMRSMSFMELGGSSVERVDLRVTDGALKLNVAEPLRGPMRSLELYGSKGSITGNALGNASPRRTRIVTHIGALDLDFRGAWIDDGRIDVLGAVAGGSVWLPDDVNLIGVGAPRPPRPAPELPRPTLTVDVGERVGRIMVVR